MVSCLQITPEKDGNKLPAQAQDECTPVQQTPKTKRTRNSTRLKKVDSPLGKNVSLTGQWFDTTLSYFIS